MTYAQVWSGIRYALREPLQEEEKERRIGRSCREGHRCRQALPIERAFDAGQEIWRLVGPRFRLYAARAPTIDGRPATHQTDNDSFGEIQPTPGPAFVLPRFKGS